MINKHTIIGLVALAFVSGSIFATTGPAYAGSIEDDISELFDRMSDVESVASQAANDIESMTNNVSELFARISDLESLTSQTASDLAGLQELAVGPPGPPGVDILGGLSCIEDDIAKWDGTSWNCAASASDSLAGDFALRKVDCNLIRSIYIDPDEEPFQFDVENGCDLTEISKFEFIDFSGAHLAEADFEDATFLGVDFTGAVFIDADFANVSFDNVDFTGADLSGVVFTNVEFEDVDFTNAFANPSCTGNNICNEIPLA